MKSYHETKTYALARRGVAPVLVLCLALAVTLPVMAFTRPAAGSPPTPAVAGPFTSGPIYPVVYQGDLRDIPRSPVQPSLPASRPLLPIPGSSLPGQPSPSSQLVDRLAQTSPGAGRMPALLVNFPGMTMSMLVSGGTPTGWPPDPNGDVGPNHYIQVVNDAVAIYDKNTHATLLFLSLNDFFVMPGKDCDTLNQGDPIVEYDRFSGRWLVTDFAFSNADPRTNPITYHQCIAISQGSDPVSGGWYFYQVDISTTQLNDYPKLGVWRDSYQMSFNMFNNPTSTDPNYTWSGVQVWAFEKAKMLTGSAITPVFYTISAATGYNSLLPAQALTNPPSGSPAYYASAYPPNRLQIWKFTVNWGPPVSSSFTGPSEMTVASFNSAGSIPQSGSASQLDSLSPRLMHRLIYRSVSGVESLWMNHTVANNAFAAVRWYEVRSPQTTPVLYQQGTYQPDALSRWMGSLAVDRDGNMALGYSISSASMFPAIRYAGRLAGEAPGILGQSESVLYQGNGSQTGTTRWGDYTAMSVDPVDDCTFWYTNEFYATTGTSWQTRIGSFKYPSCNQPTGNIRVSVKDALSSQAVPNAQVIASSSVQTMTIVTDNSGVYTLTLLAGVYSLTGSSTLPGYPIPATVNGVTVTNGNTTAQTILLTPRPNLIEGSLTVLDAPPGGNGNGVPEPGEKQLILKEGLTNNGTITSTHIIAQLTSLTPGVTITNSLSAYPNIAPTGTQTNLAAYTFAVSNTVACGSDLQFLKTITDSLKTYTLNFTIGDYIPLARANIFNNDVESGAAGWTTGGTNNTWGIITNTYHSPTHAWTDSPAGDYQNNTQSYLRSPALDLHLYHKTSLSVWLKYNLEPSADYVFLDYSLDGGVTWSNDTQALLSVTGVQNAWTQYTISTPVLDHQPAAAIRFRLSTDSGTTADGVYIDDIALSYEPFTCSFGMLPVYLVTIMHQ